MLQHLPLLVWYLGLSILEYFGVVGLAQVMVVVDSLGIRAGEIEILGGSFWILDLQIIVYTF